jgi:tripartite-type tricarboxylate transporter receptor subunit TctC
MTMAPSLIRTLAASLLLAIPALTLAASARAETWPDKPIHIIVPYVAGGNTDSNARLIGAKLSEALGQPVIIDNMPGAGANIGAGAAARAAPDGYTLFQGTGSTHGINSSLFHKLPYDPVKDFVPIVLMVESPLFLVVNADLPVKSVPELVAYAKANPGKLSFGSVGIGSAHHLAGEAFKQRGGIDIVHVPYRGSAPVLQDLMGGQIQMAFDATALQLVREGRVRALAVASSKRWPDAPEIPAMSEVGFPDFQFGGWFGLFAPAGTPRPVVERINKEVNRILQMPDVKQRLNEIGLEPLGGTPEQLAEHVTRELAKWPALVKASGAQIN